MLSSRYALAAVLAVSSFAANTIPAPEGLTVHEWGTFTSIAGPMGNAIAWLPLAGASDLPCFVHHLNVPVSPKTTMYSLVRMETPVLYFYTPKPQTVSVHVDFPQGLITEWYPKAASVQGGLIDWRDVQLSPEGDTHFPAGTAASHYYAARETDAAPLEVAGEREKLLFYRGAGNFNVPVEPVFEGTSLRLRNTGAAPIPVALVFENRGGAMGYRVLRGLTGAASVDPPNLASNPAAVRRELSAALQEMGLYPKEAEAMLATWGDSWFEEGMRVFYLAPRAFVDGVLPLEVKPAPRQTVRVFVGRIEVLSPAMRETIETALAAGDTGALAKYGRFLPRFIDLIRESHGGRLNASPETMAALAPNAVASSCR
jgi:hypothetical protein